MTRQTVAQARASLAALTPSLSDHWVGRYRGVLTEMERQAQQAADEHVAGLEEQFHAMRREALRNLTEARDGYDDLAREGVTARLSAAEYQGRLQELTSQQVRAEERLTAAAEIVERIALVEEDPVGWFSDMQERLPLLRSETPW